MKAGKGAKVHKAGADGLFTHNRNGYQLCAAFNACNCAGVTNGQMNCSLSGLVSCTVAFRCSDENLVVGFYSFFFG